MSDPFDDTDLRARAGAYLEHVYATVADRGHAVQFIFDPAGVDPGYAYTIGLSGKGLPELLVTGAPPEFAQGLLDEVAVLLAEDPLPPDPRRPLFLRDGDERTYEVRLRRAKVDPDIPLIRTVDDGPDLVPAIADRWRLDHHADQQLQVLQVLLCDPDGLWPGEAAYTAKWGGIQPLVEEAS